jgi:endonuclease-3
MNEARYIDVIMRRLSKRYGQHPRTQLDYRGPTELFVAVFLSPQCTDIQVNKVTKALFRKFKTFDDYSDADITALQRCLKGLNYYKTKARNLKRSSRMVTERFGGEIPRTISELTELPGVGRKVANVILNEWYGINEGIAVDTHCGRVAVRLGLSRHSKKPERIELDLLSKIPKKEWGRTSNLFIELGRDACRARMPQCYRCTLRNICPSSNIASKASKPA